MFDPTFMEIEKEEEDIVYLMVQPQKDKGEVMSKSGEKRLSRKRQRKDDID